MSILAQRESIAFVRLECPACATQILALVTGSPSDSEDVERTEWTASGGPGRGARPGAGEFRVEAPPIDELDVQDMHEFLAGYHGDLRALLDGPDSSEER